MKAPAKRAVREKVSKLLKNKKKKKLLKNQKKKTFEKPQRPTSRLVKASFKILVVNLLSSSSSRSSISSSSK